MESLIELIKVLYSDAIEGLWVSLTPEQEEEFLNTNTVEAEISFLEKNCLTHCVYYHILLVMKEYKINFRTLSGYQS